MYEILFDVPPTRTKILASPLIIYIIWFKDGKTRPGPRAGPGLKIQARGPYGPKRAETGLMIFI